jgi:two-component system sensor histidine kinase KdpD
MTLQQNSPKKLTGTLISMLVIGTVSAVMLPLRETVNSTTITLVYLLTVVILSTVFESWVAIAASITASLLFNYFFLKPYYTLTISEPQNLVSLFVFLAVAVTVGQLSATSNRRRVEAELLYNEIENAFDKASEAEGIKRSEKLKGALLDAVTHDFRTPLTSIKASVTMLIEDSQFGSKDRRLDLHAKNELLNVIDEEADRLNTFVESLVEVARFQSDSSDLKLSNVTAEEIVVKAARRAKEVQRSHRIVSNVVTDLPPITVDSRFIVEAVYNLIDNAAKYSPAGSKIEIAARPHNGMVRFSVEDEGSGIPESERETVFKKFYRGELQSDESRGMGMGLAIVRGIIEAHGGAIWVEAGRVGARFVFDLPISSDGSKKENTRRR